MLVVNFTTEDRKEIKEVYISEQINYTRIANSKEKECGSYQIMSYSEALSTKGRGRRGRPKKTTKTGNKKVDFEASIQHAGSSGDITLL